MAAPLQQEMHFLLTAGLPTKTADFPPKALVLIYLLHLLLALSHRYEKAESKNQLVLPFAYFHNLRNILVNRKSELTREHHFRKVNSAFIPQASWYKTQFTSYTINSSF